MLGFLRKVPIFADLAEADLRRLSEMVEEVRLPAGEVLFAEGSAGDKAFVIAKGEVEVVKASSGRDVLLAVRTPGEVIGEMALLEETPRIATVRARVDSVLLALRKEQLDDLLTTSHSAARALFYTVLSRWRATEAVLRQSERMAQLGTLTAGVAHELNNPASAVRRATDQLGQGMRDLASAEASLAEIDLSVQQRQRLVTLAGEVAQQAQRPSQLNALERSDLERELEGWLEARGVEDAWEVAPPLVAMGYDPEGVGVLIKELAPRQVVPVLRWLTSYHSVQSLVVGIGLGAGQISAIVKALKSYSFLDQAPVQEVDIHEGLDNTLLILGHKLRSHTVRREYASDLPKIQGYGSELNQVWTNILDNAADASEGRNGTITVRTRQDPNWVVVEIEDDGSGIPLNIQNRIFDAFFTTKPPGKGTGLGLNISYNIVVHHHHGEIKVTSAPGRTVFEVDLPKGV